MITGTPITASAYLGNPGLDDTLTLIGSISATQFQLYIRAILRHCTEPAGFWNSIELLKCPFLHTRASLMAADIFFNPEATVKTSMNTYFEIIASYLPYTDILATDGYMADLISKAGLLERFDTKIFSMKQRHQLMETVRAL